MRDDASWQSLSSNWSVSVRQLLAITCIRVDDFLWGINNSFCKVIIEVYKPVYSGEDSITQFLNGKHLLSIAIDNVIDNTEPTIS